MRTIKNIIYHCFKYPAHLLFKIPWLNKIGMEILGSGFKNQVSLDKNHGVINDIIFPFLSRMWFEFIYLKEKDPDKREALKVLGMGGGSEGNGQKLMTACP